MRKILAIIFIMAATGLVGGIVVQQNLLKTPTSEPIGAVLADQVTPTPFPTITPTPLPLPPVPKLTAKAYLLVSQDSDKPLIELNSQQRFPPASTTKIMTALVALKFFTPDQIVTIGTPYQVGATIDLVAGEQITIEKLLYGLLLPSGNDAAMAIADSYPGGPDQFIKQMNQLAHELNLNNTQFVNPSGLDHPEHFTTAADLVALAKVAMTHPLFSQIVATKQAIVKSQDGLITHELVNRNELLGQYGVTGVKTGYTLTAGEVLVTSIERRSGTYYIVVMGSADRFADTRLLISWLDEYLGTYKLSK